MRKLVSTKDMPREQWLEYRRKSIGGSEAAIIAGLNRYSSLYALWADKMGLLPEKEDNEQMRQDYQREIDKLKAGQKDNDAQIAIIYDMLRRNYSKVGIYKYDAFNVENSLSGGSISFALTLLNSRDNGFILNVIHNRAGCHVYLKEIKEAACEQVLAEEEKISLDMALKYDEKKETDK